MTGELALLAACAVLLAAALAVLVRPLLRPQAQAAASPDEAVYRDQLTELERDAARGLIGPREAEAARTEIARRLLAARARGPQAVAASPARRLAAALIAGVPLLAVGLYLLTGAPGLPGQPLAARETERAERQQYEQLVATLAQRMEQRPDDPQGWRLLGKAYGDLGRFVEAAAAYAAAVEAESRTGALKAETLAQWGEAQVYAAGGTVQPGAADAFRRALALDGAEPRAQFYLGLSRAQAGDLAGAVRDWRAQLAQTPADAPWRPMLEAQIEMTEREAATAAAAGAIAAMNPDAQREAVQGMVDGLAARLASDPNDLEGWLKLARAYAVLGQRDRMEAAFDRGRAVFAADPDALARFAALEDELKR